MKKFFLIACAMIMAFAASAQIVTSRSTSIKTTVKQSDNYSRWYAGYSNLSFGGEDSMHGVDLGFLKGINIANIPLFVEIGGELGWNAYTPDYRDADMYQIASVSLPVSISYKIEFDNDISIMPFTGPNFRFNVYDSELDGDQTIFQAGWNVGAGVAFGNFYVGYRFTANFNKYIEGADEAGEFNCVHIGYQF